MEGVSSSKAALVDVDGVRRMVLVTRRHALGVVVTVVLALALWVLEGVAPVVVDPLVWMRLGLAGVALVAVSGFAWSQRGRRPHVEGFVGDSAKARAVAAMRAGGPLDNRQRSLLWAGVYTSLYLHTTQAWTMLAIAIIGVGTSPSHAPILDGVLALVAGVLVGFNVWALRRAHRDAHLLITAAPVDVP